MMPTVNNNTFQNLGRSQCSHAKHNRKNGSTFQKVARIFATALVLLRSATCVSAGRDGRPERPNSYVWHISNPALDNHVVLVGSLHSNASGIAVKCAAITEQKEREECISSVLNGRGHAILHETRLKTAGRALAMIKGLVDRGIVLANFYNVDTFQHHPRPNITES